MNIDNSDEIKGASWEELEGYAQYVQDKIQLDEMPLTFTQFIKINSILS